MKKINYPKYNNKCFVAEKHSSQHKAPPRKNTVAQNYSSSNNKNNIFDVFKNLFNKIDKEDLLIIALILLLIQEEDRDMSLILALAYLFFCDRIDLDSIMNLFK